MSEVTRATIIYGEGEEKTTLRFHTIIVEDHEVSTDISKYPAQTGRVISNNSVKKNRVVSIEGIVTDTQMFNADNFDDYGGNPSYVSKAIFNTLNALVRESIPCKVQTNLGVYDPVIFTSFKTNQKSGSTAVLHFTITGEEVQIGDVLNRPPPKPVVFEKVASDAERERLITEYNIDKDAQIFTGKVMMGESFSMTTVDEAGEVMETTYEYKSYDPVKEEYQYAIHTTNVTEDGFTNDESGAQSSGGAFGLPDGGLSKGVSVVSACLVENVKGLVTNELDGYIDTAFGPLIDSIYGAYYGVVGVNGNQTAGQRLLGLGVDCFIAGAVGGANGTITADQYDSEFPSVDDVLDGAQRQGDRQIDKAGSVLAPSTLTKITQASESTSTLGSVFG